MFVYDSPKTAEAPAQAVELPDVKKSRFGDARCAQVYEQAKKYVIKNKVLRLYQNLDIRPGFKTIIICNTWRIDRCLLTATIEAFEWNYVTWEWSLVTSFENWPNIQLLPINSNLCKREGSLALAKNVLVKALWQALDAAGFKSLPTTIKGKRPRSFVAEIFIGFYLGGSKSGKKTKFNKDLTSMSAAACALRKNIWTQIIFKPILSVACALRGWGSTIFLNDYLYYALHANAVLRVAKERRNCLPLLSLIATKHWGRPDLFSRKVWVKDGRQYTLVDRQGFPKNYRLSSFMKPSTYRWLMAAPFTVVREHAQLPVARAIENIASSNLPKKVPAIVLCALIKASRDMSAAVLPEYQRILRLWVLRCCDIWREHGYGFLRRNLEEKRQELSSVLDWANAHGIGLQQPDKNASWATIERLSAEWHEQQARRTSPSQRDLVWESVLGDCDIEGFTVRALVSSAALVDEGAKMHHCVANYDRNCHIGAYRIFSLVDAEGAPSTLNIEQLADGEWRVEQLRSYCNGPVSKQAKAVARQIAKRYTELS